MHNIKYFSRLAILLFLLIYLSGNSDAQSRYEVGLGIGMNTSKFRLQSEVPTLFGDPEASFGTNFNLRIGYKIEEGTKLNLSPGLRFLNAKNPLTFSGITSTFIELPLEIQQNFHKKISFSAGLSLSYLSRLMTDGRAILSSTITEKDIIDQAKRRFFFNPKLGIQAKLGSKIEIGLTYERYSQAIIEGDPDGISGFPVSNSFLRHTNIQLSIFYIDIFGRNRKEIFSNK